MYKYFDKGMGAWFWRRTWSCQACLQHLNSSGADVPWQGGKIERTASCNRGAHGTANTFLSHISADSPSREVLVCVLALEGSSSADKAGTLSLAHLIGRDGRCTQVQSYNFFIRVSLAFCPHGVVDSF